MASRFMGPLAVLVADFDELSYASGGDPAWKRRLVRSIERLSGRPRLLALYRTWRGIGAASPDRMMREAQRLTISVRLHRP